MVARGRRCQSGTDRQFDAGVGRVSALRSGFMDRSSWIARLKEERQVPRACALMAVVKFQFPDFVFGPLVEIDSHVPRRLREATLQRVGVDRPQHPDENADSSNM